jgi:hypothetical protein
VAAAASNDNRSRGDYVRNDVETYAPKVTAMCWRASLSFLSVPVWNDLCLRHKRADGLGLC